MQKQSHNSELEVMQGIVERLGSLLTTVQEESLRTDLLTCLEQLERAKGRQQAHYEQCRKEHDQILDVVRQRNQEIRQLKKERKKQSQRHDLSKNKDIDEIRKLQKRCQLAEEAVQTLKDSRRHIENENLLKENKKLQDEVISLHKAAEESKAATLSLVQVQELADAQRQLLKTSQHIKQLESQKRTFDNLQRDYDTLERIIRIRDKHIEDLESTVVSQKEIMAEQLEQLRYYEQMIAKNNNVLDDTLRTDDTNLKEEETPDGDLACLLEAETDEVEVVRKRRRSKSKKRQNRRQQRPQTATIQESQQDQAQIETPEVVSTQGASVLQNAKALVVGLLLSVMLLFSL